MYVLGALINRRFGHFFQPPYSLAALADPRCSQEHRLRLKRDFMASRPCCLRPGLARDLRKRESFSVDSPLAESLFYSFGLAMGLSLSDTERQHKVNKVFNAAAGGGAVWHRLVAHAVNHHAKAQLNKHRQERAEFEEQVASLPALPATSSSAASAVSGSSLGIPTKAKRRPGVEDALTDSGPRQKRAKVIR